LALCATSIGISRAASANNVVVRGGEMIIAYADDMLPNGGYHRSQWFFLSAPEQPAIVLSFAADSSLRINPLPFAGRHVVVLGNFEYYDPPLETVSGVLTGKLTVYRIR
jgi:hypothetical protein